MESFGDAVILGKPPHGCDLVPPAVESFSQGNQLREAAVLQFLDGTQEPAGQRLALLACAMLL
jgi:hypothetical protein